MKTEAFSKQLLEMKCYNLRKCLLTILLVQERLWGTMMIILEAIVLRGSWQSQVCSIWDVPMTEEKIRRSKAIKIQLLQELSKRLAAQMIGGPSHWGLLVTLLYRSMPRKTENINNKNWARRASQGKWIKRRRIELRTNKTINRSKE